jgi:hypothetical protein
MMIAITAIYWVRPDWMLFVYAKEYRHFYLVMGRWGTSIATLIYLVAGISCKFYKD